MVGTEIERKFLVRGDGWRAASRNERCRQGYLQFGPAVSVRVRTMGDRGVLTIKQAGAPSYSERAPVERLEFEYPIPREEAEILLDRVCLPHLVEKTRHYIKAGSLVWEVDEFHGANAGLVVAEIELPAPDTSFERPDWIGEEVSSDARYLNAQLAQHPYNTWPETS